ncbi:MAG: 1-deoxy-D-xylulose-5-phosphate synthase [Christensenellales bacterium]|jgi:1-deoxy-D-xylulose-5-phosphate synthase
MKYNLPLESARRKELKYMSKNDLEAIACDIRDEILIACQDDGGHLASNLGVVELTLALHSICDFDQDSLLLDVGHQCYAHKLLTGRSLKNLRHEGGPSGFPTMDEGDSFGAGHAGTAISAALGIARANALMGLKSRTIAIVGDGALTNGECYEALNDAGNSDVPLLVIINDNEMSIAKNVGAMAKYLSRLSQRKGYNALKNLLKRLLGHGRIYRAAYVIERSLRQIWIESGLFDSLGFKYTGPVDGHNIDDLKYAINYCLEQNRPTVLHVITEKGRGYAPAQENPSIFHSIDSVASTKTDQQYCSDIVAKTLCDIGAIDERVCAITAAMPLSTGILPFARVFPERAFDVGIAESHAVTMACGMAARGMRPFVAIYSSFLQRSYDQIIHDMALQSLPVALLIDRAGFAPSDGATHNGLFDISFLCAIPNITLLVPRDLDQLRDMIHFAREYEMPCAIRYPKSLPKRINAETDQESLLKWQILRKGDDAAILACGSMIPAALEAAACLSVEGVHVSVTDCRSLKPLDEEALASIASMPIVTAEEGIKRGGFGEAVFCHLSGLGLAPRVEILAAADLFYPHGSHSKLLESAGLTACNIARSVKKLLKDNSF